MKRKIGVILIIIVCIANSCKTNDIIKEEFLFPKGFDGFGVIIYNQHNGVKDSIVGNKAIYRFSKNGVLLVRGQQYLTNQLHAGYFFYDVNNQKQKICTDEKFSKTCTSFLYNQSSGTYQKYEGTEKFVYSLLVIGKDSLNRKFNSSSIPFLIEKAMEKKRMNKENCIFL